MSMNIGFVSTWFERGAAYVTKAYIDAVVSKGNNAYVYARAGEMLAKKESEWNKDYVTYGLRLSGTRINKRHFYKWIKDNKLDIVFFNEQHEFDITAKLKKDFSSLKVGAYIDYYKEDTVDLFHIYDFIICNTKRHYSVFKNHDNSYYVPWGTDTALFKPRALDREHDKIVFFHSAGMSDRKGTDLLIQAFIKGVLYQKSKLIIHTQVDLKTLVGYSIEELENYNIEIIEKTVTAPGLYCMGDVYVYPTKLEGIGLSIFEAMASGLPVIVTDHPPMNEFINNDIGKLIKVNNLFCRSDAYYWPLAQCSINSLIEKMQYYIDNQQDLESFKKTAREYAIKHMDWKSQYDKLNNIFEVTPIQPLNQKAYHKIMMQEKRNKITALKTLLSFNNKTGEIIKLLIDRRRS